MLQLVVITAITFAIGAIPQIQVDNYSHIGGFLMGIFTAIVFLPPLRRDVWTCARLLVGIAGSLGLFVGVAVAAF